MAIIKKTIIVPILKLISPIFNQDTVLKEIEYKFEGSNLGLEMSSVFISDIHFDDNYESFIKFYETINQIKNIKPDVIFLGGDYLGDFKHYNKNYEDRIISAFNKLSKIAPVYAIAGNHEYYNNSSFVDALKNSNVNLLINECSIIKFRGAKICLRGFGDNITNNYQYIPYPNDQYDLYLNLVHDPYLIQLINEKGFYLAGHTHDGQIRIPYVNPSAWIPSEAKNEYINGFNQDSVKSWYTSSGYGTSTAPIRIGTQSEIVLIRLKF